MPQVLERRGRYSGEIRSPRRPQASLTFRGARKRRPRNRRRKCARETRTRTRLTPLVREGDPPLDFRSGFENRLDVELDGVEIPVAGLLLLTTLKRLADRPQDRVDLEELERIHGPLPSSPLEGSSSVE
jgi:hypothetical protein